MRSASYNASVAWVILLCIPSTTTPFSVKNFFNSAKHQEAIEREYALQRNGTLSIENTNGSITIKTEWDKGSIKVFADKRTKSEEDAGSVRLVATQLDENQLSLHTEHATDSTPGGIDYTLVVPPNITLKLTTKTGDITVNESNGRIQAHTDNGTIELRNPRGPVVASTEGSGAITIHQPGDSVSAITNRGKIELYDTTKSILASSTSGAIDVHCQELPATNKLWLKSESGIITVFVPEETDADLEAITQRGVVTCEHAITLKPQETTLDRAAWKRFKKEVRGTLGSAGFGHIKVSSLKSNIRVKRYIQG